MVAKCDICKRISIKLEAKIYIERENVKKVIFTSFSLCRNIFVKPISPLRYDALMFTEIIITGNFNEALM